MERKLKKTANFSPNILINNTQPNPQGETPPPEHQEEHNIYHSRTSSQPEEGDSSFELEPDLGASNHQKENMDKLLDRLGLREQLKIKSSNQELELVVNNFLEHCIGTVDRKANTQQYDLLYDQAYQEKVKTAQNHPNSTIFISELTEL